ncbi:predicted protein [Histoplasma mississippiense (nom. inval.)]|uniref:predicted protein n=1 Tax=Ajellomyces capsulatus (strain NAm1 / WU24) TaxID=2059318 RepID=UPI000157D486|nr:predicted protein [Histoplasma mississippiense (nom. inval.)]EDN05080.1 predicted protein [Histoplasma mississippiense (nom. inval.)]
MASNSDNATQEAIRQYLCCRQQLIRLAAAEVIHRSISTVSPGIRSMYSDPFRGFQFTTQLLDPTSHPLRIKNMTRMSASTFIALVDWLRSNTDIRESEPIHAIKIEQKVLIFLYITTQGVFHEVLESLCVLYEHYVKMPESPIKKALGSNPRYWPFFKESDAGYSQKSSLMLVPYSGVRYHLKEWEKANSQPVNASELYNLRHASLQGVIERVFGVFKRRFQIYDRCRDGFSITTQIDLVFALAAVHNFMNHYKEMDELTQYDENSDIEEERRETVPADVQENGDEIMKKRDDIAKQMWKQYKEYLNGNHNYN